MPLQILVSGATEADETKQEIEKVNLNLILRVLSLLLVWPIDDD